MSDLPIPVWDLYKSIKPDEIGWTEPVLLKLSESHSAAFYVALLHLWSVGRPSTCLPRLSSSPLLSPPVFVLLRPSTRRLRRKCVVNAATFIAYEAPHRKQTEQRPAPPPPPPSEPCCLCGACAVIQSPEWQSRPRIQLPVDGGTSQFLPHLNQPYE